MSDDTKFCNNCGNSLADVTPTQPGNSDNAGPQQSGSPFPMPVISSTAGDQQGQGMPQNSTDNMNSMNQSGMDQNSMGQQPQPGMNPLFSAPPVEAPEKKKNPFVSLAEEMIYKVSLLLNLNNYNENDENDEFNIQLSEKMKSFNNSYSLALHSNNSSSFQNISASLQNPSDENYILDAKNQYILKTLLHL